MGCNLQGNLRMALLLMLRAALNSYGSAEPLAPHPPCRAASTPTAAATTRAVCRLARAALHCLQFLVCACQVSNSCGRGRRIHVGGA